MRSEDDPGGDDINDRGVYGRGRPNTSSETTNERVVLKEEEERKWDRHYLKEVARQTLGVKNTLNEEGLKRDVRRENKEYHEKLS